MQHYKTETAHIKTE